MARSFGRRGRAVHLLLEASDGSLAERSRFVQSTTHAATADCVADQWADWCVRSAPRGAVVIPCADRGLEFVSQHRAMLQQAGLYPAPAKDDIVLALLDKQLCYEMARRVGMAVPRTERVTGSQQALAAGKTFELPFALKPRISHLYAPISHGPKAVVMRTYHDLERHVNRFADADLSMILTEIIPGSESSYCSYNTFIDHDGRPLAHFTKRKLRQYPVGFGEGSYHLTDWAPDVAEAGFEFFSSIGLQGMANVEFKRDDRDGSLKLIECNSRLTAANELVRRAGVDFAEIIYQRALGQSAQPVTTYRQGLAMWLPMHDLLAFSQLRSTGELTTSDWLSSLGRRQVPAVLDLADPGPTVTKVAQLLRWGGRRALPNRAQSLQRAPTT